MKVQIKYGNKKYFNNHKFMVDKIILLCYNVYTVKGSDKVINGNKKPNINKGEKLWKENLLNLKTSKD